MFNRISIKPTENTFPLDIGFIAESLLYYKNVLLILSSNNFQILIRNCGLDNLFELLERGNLKVLIKENHLGTMSQTLANGNILNDVALISSEKHKTENVIFEEIFKYTGRRGYSKRQTNKFMNFIEPIQYENGICDYIRNDLDDEAFVKQTIIDTVQIYNPQILLNPSDIHYEKIKTEKGFFFLTNLNFDEINKHLLNNPDGKKINPTGLILNIQETRGDMHLAADLDSEIATNPINTQLMKLKFRNIYEKSKKSSDEIFRFNDFILDNGHAIREVINSGEKDFKDFIKLLNRADKFKDWLNNLDNEKNIIKEYHKEVTKDTWIDKLPGKSFRWSFFTGLGFAIDAVGAGGIGTATGLAISAGDALILDKIIKGWNPSVFVNNELLKIMRK